MMIPLLGKFVSSIRKIVVIGTNGRFHKWEHWFPLLLSKCYKQFFRRRYIFWFFLLKGSVFPLVGKFVFTSEKKVFTGTFIPGKSVSEYTKVFIGQ